MAPAHSRRRAQRRSCRRQDAAATDDLSDLAESVASAAARLARELNDPAVDRDDIEQELWIRLYTGMPRHDPARGDRVRFARMLLKRHRATLTRARYAEKRQTPTKSLEQPVDGDGQIRIDAIVSGDRRLAELGQVRRAAVDHADMRIDVQSVAAALSPDQQNLVEELKSKSIAEAARQVGVPRTTLNDQIRVLRKPFEQGGMKEFLE